MQFVIIICVKLRMKVIPTRFTNVKNHTYTFALGLSNHTPKNGICIRVFYFGTHVFVPTMNAFTLSLNEDSDVRYVGGVAHIR